MASTAFRPRSEWALRRRWPRFIGLVVLACAGSLAFGRLAAVEADLSWLLISGTGLTVVGGVVLRRANGGLDPFDPFLVFLAAYTVTFVVRPIALIVENDFLYDQLGDQNVSAGFNSALALGWLGAIGFIGGYLSPVGRRIARRRRPVTVVDETALLAVCAALAFVGVLLFSAFLVQAGGLSALSGRSVDRTAALQDTTKYLYFGPLLLIPAALAFIAVGTRQRRPWVFAGGLVAGGLLLLFAGPTGSRGSLLPLVGALVIFAFVRKGKRPSLPAIVAIIALALTVSTFLLYSRQVESRADTGVTTQVVRILTNPAVTLDPILRGPDAAIVPGLSAAFRVVPSQVPHTYGLSTFGDFVFRPIPRALWAGKPLPPRERVIKALAPQRYAQGTANPEFSSLLTFYVDFGLLGALGLALFGIAARFIYEYLRAFPEVLSVQVIFALSVPFFISAVRDSTVDTFTRVVFTLGPICLALALAARARAKPQD